MADRSSVPADVPDALGEIGTPISTLAMVQEPRLRRLFACVGFLLDDSLLDADLSEAVLSVMLDIAPEFVPPYCNEPEDWQAWHDLLNGAAPGVFRWDDHA